MQSVRRWASALSDGLDRVTPARLYLVGVITFVVMAHGFAPKRFLADGTTVGLLGVLLVVVLVPLLESATFPGGGGLRFRDRVQQVLNDSEAAAAHPGENILANRPLDLADEETPADTSVEPRSSSRMEGFVPPTARFMPSSRSSDQVIRDILEQAGRSPTVGLISLSNELARAVRELLVCTGWATPDSNSLNSGIDRLVELGVLSRSAASAAYGFMTVRNEVVHGQRNAGDKDILGAVDAAIPLLRAVLAIPREHNVVANEGVPLFADESLSVPILDAVGLILETVSPGGASVSYRIFPTTRRDYVVGKEVTWEWDSTMTWGPAWYKDPESGQVNSAWGSAMGFAGRHLDEI